jgi:hypothetical protein
MIISNILFFIECVEQLRPSYNNKKTSLKQRKQLATFLKTWIWYNSHSENIFWTGLSTKDGQNLKRVKEHWYSNLTTAEFLLKTGITELSKKDQILWVFERMRWNYTSRKENKDLIAKQQFHPFYNEYKGNPSLVYKSLGFELEIIEKEPFSERLINFINKKRTANTVIVEIGFSGNEHKPFKKGINYSLQTLESKCQVFEISNKNIIVEATSFSQLFKTLMSGLWALMDRDEIINFIGEYGYGLEKGIGPFRIENNFEKEKNRVFSVKTKHGKNIFMTTYNDNSYKYSLLIKIVEYLDIELTIFDSNFNEINY